MKKFNHKILWIILLNICTLWLSSTEMIDSKESESPLNEDLVFNTPLKAQPIEDFFLITIPKSGSHLLVKALVMISDLYPYGLHDLHPLLPNINEETFEKAILGCKESNHFAFNHTGLYGDFFKVFSKKHPEYVQLLMIRDLRDIFVSYVYHVNQSIEEQYGPFLTFGEKLDVVLDIAHYPVSKELEKDIIVAIEWLNDPKTIVNRFEELVGESGGGSNILQLEALKKLMCQLGIDLPEDKIIEIQENLFGIETGPQNVSGTFRCGKIGSWKSHFKPHHIELFKKYWAHYQSALNYSLDFESVQPPPIKRKIKTYRPSRVQQKVL